MIEQEKPYFDRLLSDYAEALRDYGLAYSTQLNLLQKANTFVKWMELHDVTHLDKKAITEYYNELDSKLLHGDIKKHRNYELHHQVDRFLHYSFTGEMRLPYSLKGARTKLTTYFSQIVDDYLSSGTFNSNTICDMRWVAYKYFSWLSEQGYDDLTKVNTPQITQFMLYCLSRMSQNSIHDIRLYLSKLYIYLYKAGLAKSDYNSLFSFPVNRETKVYPPLPKDEIADMLDTIDRKSVIGKRAYAVMLLGVVLGLRACDVIRLKLGDIDWINGEIKIIQSKTGETVILPLTKDVGTALQDYILNARPKSTYSEVFLGIRGPNKPLASAVTAGEIYRDCRRRAGLPADKKFHNLRRTLGTSMIAGGVIADTAAQTLGHTSLNSLKPYVAVDTVHLKLCALSLDGIEPFIDTLREKTSE